MGNAVEEYLSEELSVAEELEAVSRQLRLLEEDWWAQQASGAGASEGGRPVGDALDEGCPSRKVRKLRKRRDKLAERLEQVQNWLDLTARGRMNKFDEKFHRYTCSGRDALEELLQLAERLETYGMQLGEELDTISRMVIAHYDRERRKWRLPGQEAVRVAAAYARNLDEGLREISVTLERFHSAVAAAGLTCPLVLEVPKARFEAELERLQGHSALEIHSMLGASARHCCDLQQEFVHHAANKIYGAITMLEAEVKARARRSWRSLQVGSRASA